MNWYWRSWTKLDFTVSDLNPTGILPALEHTVLHICATYPPPYTLMVSGGLDSQMMLWAWCQWGRDYEPTSVRYNGDMNAHDLKTLIEFSDLNAVDIEYVDFDVLEFYQSRTFEDICWRYQCVSPQFAAHLAMTENLKGTIIFSGDRLSEGGSSIRWPQLCYFRRAQEQSMIPQFFLATPELAYSEIVHRLNFKKSKTTRLPGLAGRQQENQQKAELCQDLDIPVAVPETKFTGFEKIKQWYDLHRPASVLDRLKFADRISKRSFDIRLRYPWEKRFEPFPTLETLITRIETC